MTLLVSLIALLIERFFDWSHLRHWRWFFHYQQYIVKKLPSQSSFLILGLIIIPFMLVILLIQLLTKGWLYGFISLLWQLFLLLYCLGPQNFWADSFACINALSQDDKKVAQDKLKSSFNIDTRYSQSLHRHFLNMIFIEANRRVFAVIVWYVLLGPAGIILYRMVTLCSTDGLHTADENLGKAARQVEMVLNWLPVRLFAFFFALGGHFVQVFARFRKSNAWRLEGSEVFLGECGEAAIGFDDAGEVPSDCLMGKSAISLIDRACVLLLVVIAIIHFLS